MSGAKDCIYCHVGKYGSIMNAAACIACPIGKTTEQIASQSESQLPLEARHLRVREVARQNLIAKQALVVHAERRPVGQPRDDLGRRELEEVVQLARKRLSVRVWQRARRSD